MIPNFESTLQSMTYIVKSKAEAERNFTLTLEQTQKIQEILASISQIELSQDQTTRLISFLDSVKDNKELALFKKNLLERSVISANGFRVFLTKKEIQRCNLLSQEGMDENLQEILVPFSSQDLEFLQNPESYIQAYAKEIPFTPKMLEVIEFFGNDQLIDKIVPHLSDFPSLSFNDWVDALVLLKTKYRGENSSLEEEILSRINSFLRNDSEEALITSLKSLKAKLEEESIFLKKIDLRGCAFSDTIIHTLYSDFPNLVAIQLEGDEKIDDCSIAHQYYLASKCQKNNAFYGKLNNTISESLRDLLKRYFFDNERMEHLESLATELLEMKIDIFLLHLDWVKNKEDLKQIYHLFPKLDCVKGVSADLIPFLWPSLKKLEITHGDVSVKNLSHLPGLEELVLENFGSGIDSTFVSKVSNSLKKISVLEGDFQEDGFSHLHQLEEVDFGRNVFVDEKFIKQLPPQIKKLTILNGRFEKDDLSRFSRLENFFCGIALYEHLKGALNFTPTTYLIEYPLSD